MFRKLSLLLFASFLSFQSNAATISSLSTTLCSGALNYSLDRAVIYTCAGNLTLGDGNISSDAYINISATGSILFNNLSVVAPTLSLTAADINVGDKVSIYTNNFDASNGTSGTPHISASSTASLIIGSGDNAHVVPFENISLNSGSGGSTDLGAGGNIQLAPVPLPPAFILLFSAIFAYIGASFRFHSERA